MKKHIRQLVDIKKLQSLFDSLYESTGIPSALLDHNGDILTQSGWQKVCLDFHRVNPETREICLQSDLAINRKIEKGETFIIYQCPMGLIDSSYPIIINDHHVASVFTGQFIHSPLTEDDLEQFRRQARKYGFEEETYLEAIRKVPVITPEKHNNFLSFLSQLTENIVTMATQSLVIAQSENKIRETMEAVHVGLWEWDLKEQTGFFNKRCYEILGYSPNAPESDAETFFSMVHPIDRPRVVASINRAINKKTDLREECRIQRADLSQIWVEIRGKVIERETEDLSQLMLGTISDISVRKRLKRAFEKSFHNSPLLMTLSEVDTGRYIDANQSFYEVTGYSPRAVIGTSSVDLGIISADERRMLLEILKKQGAVKKLRLKLRKADGEHLFCDCSAVTIDVDSKQYLLVQAIDVTDQLKAERDKETVSRQLRQAQKMEAIGTLAGGIAHDFNNILSAMLGYTDMAMEDIDKETRTWQDLQNVMTAGYRAKELVGQILTFSRQRETVKVKVNPATILKEVVKLLRSTFPSTIKISQEILWSDGAVYADPVQLHQVIMNICTNAFHAMGDSCGTIDLSLRRSHQLAERIQRDASRIGVKYLQLSISDTGSGIDPSILDRIFDPFFTTKEEGRGTGMGLATAYGIMADLGGAITVESTPGKGTTFHLFFPELGDYETEASACTLPLPTGSESIMVVDDEEALVFMYGDQLKRLGYKVIGIQDSLEAVRLFEESPDSIDLLITDYTMPGMTGLELARIVLEFRPDLPILLCTGYSEHVNEKIADKHGIKGFLYKPLLKSDMAVKVRELLDSGK